MKRERAKALSLRYKGENSMALALHGPVSSVKQRRIKSSEGRRYKIREELKKGRIFRDFNQEST